MKKPSILMFLIFLITYSPVKSQNPTPKIDQKKFEALYRSAKSIQAATQVGVNYIKFGELMQSMATELSIAKDKTVSDSEKELVALYGDALQAYSDSHTLWKAKNSITDRASKGLIVYSTETRDRKGRISNPVVSRELVPIVEKYHLELTDQKERFSNFYWKSISPSSIQVVWKAADEILDRANRLYSGDSTQ